MSTTPYRSISQVFKAFLKLLNLDRKEISSIYVFAMLAGLVQLSLPLGIQTIIGFVQAGAISTSIVVLIVLVVGGTFLNGLLIVRQMQIIEKLKQKIFVRYSFEFANKIPFIDKERKDQKTITQLSNRYFEIPTLQKGIEKILLDLPTAIIQIFLGLVLLSFYHPVFIGFGILLLIIVYAILYYTAEQGFSASLQASDYKYKIASWLQSLAKENEENKPDREIGYGIEKTDQLSEKFLATRTKYFQVLLTQAWSFIGFKVLITAAMLLVGTVLLINQKINIGQFIAADIVIISIISSVEKLIASLDKVYDSFTAIEKMSSVVDAPIHKK